MDGGPLIPSNCWQPAVGSRFRGVLQSWQPGPTTKVPDGHETRSYGKMCSARGTPGSCMVCVIPKDSLGAKTALGAPYHRRKGASNKSLSVKPPTSQLKFFFKSHVLLRRVNIRPPLDGPGSCVFCACISCQKAHLEQNRP